ncbi:E3 ubiquitin-protein ligase RNF10 isoform X2 [Parasteatoda tepidariorum]|uniref:E3 ubiquitin-protein ligase RNF10 isoform X2 n=1 Tax=Parasteatoda tepidariorum TaxID=114398 RepID=UPI0039BD3E6F
MFFLSNIFFILVKYVANKHIRLPRVKESHSPRPDTRKKQNPQRNRELFDKRPRNKNGAMYEKYRSEVTQVVNEPSYSQGCKKANLNHLLNFTLDAWDGRRSGSGYNKNKGSKHPKYNKELFLQANCQFVARDNRDYSMYQNNPDKLVEWSLIEEIRLTCHEMPSCPICLHIPTAAKITRCGHVYCWPCILHYLALTDKSWQKCPICFEAVHKTDLKSVSIKLCKSYSVGDEIKLCLMKREKGSLISLPVSIENAHTAIFTVNDGDCVIRFQKLLMAGQKEVFSIIERENRELRAAYEMEKDTPEACFIESAFTLIHEREIALNQNVDQLKELISRSNGNVPERKHLISTSSTESYEELHEINGNLKFGMSQQHGICDASMNSISDCERKGVTFFYQAEDGQHIYMHNINVKMLLKEYGSLEFAPETITAKLVEIERVTMTEVLRKRLRYLQHLPLTCEFNTAELDFSSVVSKETMSQFEGEVLKRKHMRIRKARDERRREKMIEREENKKLGKYPKATYNLSSIDQFPVYNPEDYLSNSPPKETIQKADLSGEEDNSNIIDEESACSYPAIPENQHVPTTSFAQMLKVGPKSFSQSAKEVKPRVVTPIQECRYVNTDEEDDEGTPAPEFHQSFSDAIQAALNSVSLQDHADVKSVSKKKKKGKKQQLLFTTSMCRTK